MSEREDINSIQRALEGIGRAITSLPGVLYIRQQVSRVVDGTEYAGGIPIILSNPLGSTGYDGNDTIAPGTYTIDTSAWGAPAGIRAACVLVIGQWAAASNNSLAGLRSVGGSVNYCSMRAMVANISIAMQGWVACDGNGDFDLVVENANMTSTVMRIIGYSL
jgi:hypothetical protein